MTANVIADNWNADVNGAFNDASDWSRGAPDDALSSQTAYDADIGGAGVTKGSGAFTVASSGLATVNSLDIGAANATLALTGGTFTVDNIQSGVGGASIAVDLGAINVSASATLAFGTIADSAVPLANGADNYAYSGELLDTGGALNIAAGGALQIDEPRFKFLSNGKAGVVTLAGDAVIQGATTIGDTLENVNNLIQGAGTIGNGAGSGSAVEGGLVLQNDAAGVIDANAATAMTIDTGAEKDENSGLIETTGAGGLIIDSDIAQNGLLIAAGTGAISINDAHVGGNRGNDIVQSGGRIVLNGSQLTTGGTISVAAGGTITTVAGADDNLGVASNNAGVGDDLSSGAIENSGTIEIANGTTLNLDGSVYNNGAGSRIWLDGATSATTLEIYGGGAAIYGAGALVMSNSENNAIVANGAAEQLGVYGTISGAGVIDGGGTDDLLRLYVATTGVVNANDADAMTIYGDSAAADAGSESADYNAGLIETTGTGGLTIDIDAGLERSDPTSGTDFGNVGAIDATGSGALVLENGTLLGGGVLQTTAAGATIILDNLVSAENSVKIVKGSLLETTAGDGGDLLANLANYGTVAVVAGSTLEARHSWLNAGTVELHGSSASQLSTLEVSDLTLTGGGTVNLNAYGTIAGAQTGADGGEAWLNNMSDTILGSGVIGALDGDTDLSLQNFGTIDATGGVAQTMTIDTGAQAIGNDGTIETTAAGGLTIIGAQGTNFSQGGGLYQDGSLIAEGSGALTLEDIVVSGDGSYDVAKSGASIVLDGSSVAGGVFTLVAGGELIARSGTSDQLVAKSNIANAGAIWVQGGATLELDGKISDASTGAIDIGDANGAATLKIDGYGARITGGAITLSDNAGNRIVSGESDEYLWSSATITGDGTIGDADLSFQNLSGGVVDANDSGGLTLVADIANNGLQMAGNSGVIETTGAGNLMIDGALDAGAQNFSNSGLIDEAGWGTLTLNAIDDAAGGGTVEATGTGKLVLEDDSLISVGVVSVAARATIATTSGDSDDAIEANMSLSGDVDVADRSRLTVDGNWEGSGSILLGTASGGSADIAICSNHTWELQGGGMLFMNGSDDVIAAQGPAGPGGTTLTNVSDTILGAGVIGNAELTLQNEAGGTIDATGAMTLNTGDDTIYNAGLIETTSGGSISIESAIDNAGDIVANAGSIDFRQAVSNSAGVVTINGNASVTIGADFDNDVDFGAGASAGGTLILDNSTTEDPTAILGFDGWGGGMDKIDLRDIDFASANFSYSYAGGALDGVLTVTDGTNTTNLHLIGDFAAGAASPSFVLKSDNHGGTLVT